MSEQSNPVNRDQCTYLGDGVYAWFDGEFIILRTQGESNDNVIYLDRTVMQSLREYAKKVKL